MSQNGQASAGAAALETGNRSVAAHPFAQRLHRTQPVSAERRPERLQQTKRCTLPCQCGGAGPQPGWWPPLRAGRRQVKG